MRVLVCGSRDWPSFPFIQAQLLDLIRDPEMVIVGHARGADIFAEGVAVSAGWPLLVVRPDWRRWGKMAGFHRNNEMLDELQKGLPSISRLVIAFHYKKSSGTQHTVSQAILRGIKTVVFTERDL